METNAAGQLAGASVTSTTPPETAPKRFRQSDSGETVSWPVQMARALPVVVGPAPTDAPPGYHESITEENARGSAELFAPTTDAEESISNAMEVLNATLGPCLGRTPKLITDTRFSSCKEVLALAIKSNADHPQALKNLGNAVKRMFQRAEADEVNPILTSNRTQNLEKLEELCIFVTRTIFEAREVASKALAKVRVIEANVDEALSIYKKYHLSNGFTGKAEISHAEMTHFERLGRTVAGDKDASLVLMRAIEDLHRTYELLDEEEIHHPLSSSNMGRRQTMHDLRDVRRALFAFYKVEFDAQEADRTEYARTGRHPVDTAIENRRRYFGHEIRDAIIDLLNPPNPTKCTTYNDRWMAHACAEIKKLCADPTLGSDFYLRNTVLIAQRGGTKSMATEPRLAALYAAFQEYSPIERA